MASTRSSSSGEKAWTRDDTMVTAPMRSPRRCTGTIGADLLTMFVRVGDAPCSSRADDAAHGRTCEGKAHPRHSAEDAARRGHLDESIVVEQSECGAVGLRDVGSRLAKPVEHSPGIQLQGDLLTEPPHAMEDALRIVELERALDHALFE
jgi:hypothetical protein